VNLLEPNPTAYDLCWRMFGIPVRVHPMFWLMSIFLGVDIGKQLGPLFLLLWVICVFVSVLIHELGHVFVGRWFGAEGHIVLYSFGGLAIGSNNLRNRWKRIAVCFAGPFAEFLLLGVVWLVKWSIDLKGLPHSARPAIAAALIFLIEINLFWGLLNLLPIWPLDGGQISRDFLDWLDPGKGVRTSLIISMLVAGVLAVNSLAAYTGKPVIPYIGMGDLFMTFFFTMFAVQSYQLLQQLPARRRTWEADRDEPWQVDTGGYREQDPDWWKR
jgi:Zn-dependent protease